MKIKLKVEQFHCALVAPWTDALSLPPLFKFCGFLQPSPPFFPSLAGPEACQGCHVFRGGEVGRLGGVRLMAICLSSAGEKTFGEAGSFIRAGRLVAVLPCRAGSLYSNRERTHAAISSSRQRCLRALTRATGMPSFRKVRLDILSRAAASCAVSRIIFLNHLYEARFHRSRRHKL